MTVYRRWLRVVSFTTVVITLFLVYQQRQPTSNIIDYEESHPRARPRLVDRNKQTSIGRNDHIVIIGSGPTALGAAQRLYELQQEFNNNKTRVTILEQENHPGGLASSERDDQGFLWDMGGHVVFSHYVYFDRTLDRAVPDWNRRVRAAFAFMKGSDGKRRFIPYPVQNNIEVMDKIDQEKSLSGLEEITRYPITVKPTNFDEWLVKNFGIGLCDVFMRKYNKKVWTINSTEMNSIWVGERVAIPDVKKIKAKISAFNQGTSVKDSAWGPNRFFRFPSFNGTGNIWRGVAQLIPRYWFLFQTRVTNVDLDSKTVLLDNGTSLNYDTLISTIPLDNFVNMLRCKDKTLRHKQMLASQLVYSHTHVVGIGLTGQPPMTLSDKSWMYFPDSDSPFYRVTVFSNYSNDHVPKPGAFWSLMCEAAEPKNNSNPKYWKPSNLVTATVNALIEYGFISGDMVVSKYHRRLDHGYPVPSLTRDSILDTIQPWLESKDVYSRGRFGGWRYEVSNQDHSFMQGVEVVDRIVRGFPEETYANPHFVNSRKNMGRVLQRSMDYEFVISHYMEALDWMKPFAQYSYVYHKGTGERPPFDVYKWKKLPNVGREAHTYLYHIIANYDNLANITVFLQGHDQTLNKRCFRKTMDYVVKAKESKFCKVSGPYNEWGRIHYSRNGKWAQIIRDGKMRRTNLTLGGFYQEIFGKPPPVSVRICYRGCFSATRENIRKHPKFFYQKVISFLKDHDNPEEGHYMERLWCHIINC